MSRTTPAPDLILAAPEVAREFACWLAYLSAERRMSPKTVEAYERVAGMWLVGEDMPQETNRVTLDPKAKDKFGLPVASVHYDDHPNDVAMRDLELLSRLSFQVPANGSAAMRTAASPKRANASLAYRILVPPL